MASYTEATQQLMQLIRSRINAMSTADRAYAVRHCGAANTHVYAFLRGNDQALSPDRIDELMKAAGFELNTDYLWTRRKPVSSPTAQRIIEMVQESRSAPEIAEMVGLSVYRVYDIAWQNGLRVHGNGALNDRNAQIVEMRHQGHTYGEIAQEYGISKQRAMQIVRRHEER